MEEEAADGRVLMQFCRVLKQTEIDYANEDIQKELYTKFKSALSSVPTSSTATQTPLPLPIALYALRSILYPTLVREQCIDVVRLLAHVEEVRVGAGERARAVLRWNEHFVSKHGQDSEEVRTMREDSREMKRVKKVARERREGGRLRVAYKRLVASFQRLDIYSLWLSPTADILSTRLETYFPSLWPVPGESAEERQVRVTNVRESERMHWGEDEGENEKTGQLCLEFVREAAEWKVNRRAFCSWKGVDEEATFEEVFPPPVDEDVLVSVAEEYITEVEKLVNVLEELFGDDYGEKWEDAI